jgi:hypothetical protein
MPHLVTLRLIATVESPDAGSVNGGDKLCQMAA